MLAARSSPYHWGALLFGVLGLGACSEEQGSAAPAPLLLSTPPDMPYAPCSSAQRVGEFLIERAEDYTSVEGKLYDAVTPGRVSEVQASAGECELLSLPLYSCSPGCPVSTQTCSAEGQCVPLPQPRTVGEVHVRGMVVPVELTANAVTGGYRPRGAALPHPAFEPGATLLLEAAGGDFSAFELWGWGIFPLTEVDSPVHVAAGEPSLLGWPAPAAAGPGRMHVSLNVNNHGRNNAWIECSFEDDGAAEIPAQLIDLLLLEGQSGFPTITFSRRTVTSTEVEWGCVQLAVSSSVSVGVALAGLTSCNDSSMCPSGQTCRPLERFCE